MAKVKTTVSKEAYEEAAERTGDWTEAPPGLYVAQLTSAEVVDSKKTKVPQVECIYRITGVGRDNEKPEENYGQMWDYVQLEGEATDWKRAQFALAYGIPRNRQGGIEFENDPRKPGTIVGRQVLIRVKADRNADPEDGYRAKINAVYAYESNGTATAEEGSLDEPVFDEAAAEDEGATVTELHPTEEPGDDSELTEPMTREEILAMEKADVKELAAEWEVDIPAGTTFGDVVTMIIAAQEDYFKDASEGDTEDAGNSEDDPF